MALDLMLVKMGKKSADTGHGTWRVSNVGPVVSMGDRQTEFVGLDGKVFKIPVSTKNRPWVEIADVDAAFLLKLYCGPLGAPHDLGLRPFYEGTDAATGANEDAETMRMIDEIAAGKTVPARKRTDAVNRPWARATRRNVSKRELTRLPDETTSDALLERFIVKNGLEADIPSGATRETKLAVIRALASVSGNHMQDLEPAAAGTSAPAPQRAKAPGPAAA